MPGDEDETAYTTPPRSKAAAALLAAFGALFFASFLSLGTWQLERRTWKHELVARVDQRVGAAAVAAPGPADWPALTAANAEYRHVSLTGRFQHAQQTLVQAVTRLGSGFWVLTPLRTADGMTVLVNRGFVPSEARAAVLGEAGEVTVTGLLRITEPGGGFLRQNDATAGQWFSRDVAAIASARGLSRVAPYFVDAAAASPTSATNALAVPADAAAGVPVGGLTVIAFPDHHLVYALTWYALAFMVLGGAWRVVIANRRARSYRQAPTIDGSRDNAGSVDGGRQDAPQD